MPLYETVIIARQDLASDDVDKLSEKFSKIITDDGGKIISTEYWGLRNFAYKIKKYSRGHYILLNIDAKVSSVKELERVVGFNEDVLRCLFFKVDKHEDKTSLFVAKNAASAKSESKKEDKKPSELDLKIASVRIEV